MVILKYMKRIEDIIVTMGREEAQDEIEIEVKSWMVFIKKI